jgi:hypothetical protein
LTQQRAPLFDLYTDVLSDGRLKRLINTRIEAITNRKLVFTINGKQVDDVERLTKYTFFNDFVKEAMQATFWGHSLLLLDWATPTDLPTLSTTKLIPRKHVKPRFGIVTQEQWGMTGTNYRDMNAANIIEIGTPEDLGDLMEVAQYTIYKRGNFGDWAEYAELFGTPFRWATYNNPQTQAMLEEAMEKAGSAGYVVAPEDAKIQFLGNAGHNGNDIFRFFLEACNTEMSICILGNTMTSTEAKSSGYAQSYTHKEAQDELHKADRLGVLRILNEKLTPYLAALGYQVEGGMWDFEEEETISLTERLDIDLKVASKVPIPVSYWYEKYKIPMPKAGEATTDPITAEDLMPNDGSNPNNPKEPKNKQKNNDKQKKKPS